MARRAGRRTRPKFQIGKGAVAALKRGYRRVRNHEAVQRRIELSCDPMPEIPSRDDVWRGLALALTTSQQRSAPGSRVYDLWSTDPCPLGLKRVQSWYPNVRDKTAKLLRRWGGVRFYNNIGKYIEEDYRMLFKDGLIDDLDGLVRRLWELRQSPPKWDEEARAYERRLCAEALELDLYGIGFKQCRNWLQGVGLLRYEIPLDSRVRKFLTPFMSGQRIEGDRLGKATYYHAAEDAVHAVCKEVGLLPCVADIVMFLIADED